MKHRPVLLEEAVAGLAIQPGGLYADGTFGRGGHARAILARLGSEGRLLALDKDPQAIAVAQEQFLSDKRFMIERGSFAMLKRHLEKRGGLGKVSGVLLDLGVSSPQLDDPGRGFSFSHDGPLDMRMDPQSGPSAADWLAVASEREIVQVLRDYGEERYAKRIAAAILQARAATPIRTTGQLAGIVRAAHPAWEKDRDPATRSFQALRIFINQELDDLETCLPQCVEALAPGGRLAVISFHSLEDRIVKRFMRKEARGGEFPAGLPITQAHFHPTLRIVGKAIHASAVEVQANPRARSAVLRVAERLP
jgi:16S rRNA (cytosine1402-N4)-methyltransferase